MQPEPHHLHFRVGSHSQTKGDQALHLDLSSLKSQMAAVQLQLDSRKSGQLEAQKK